MRLLFLGEGDLSGPARYLAAILTYAGISFDHRGDRQPIPTSWLSRPYDSILLSDYRHASFSKKTENWVVNRVHAGTGLLMIGGWASFTGLVGRYGGTAIEKLLPVSCLRPDDRVNRASVVDAPGRPLICGYHRVKLKPGSKVRLSHRDLTFKQGQPRMGLPKPLWVTGQAGRGRTAAFLTDCAPHWAGSLVDWGRRRITVEVAKNVRVETGDRFLQFFTKLIRWTARGAALLVLLSAFTRSAAARTDLSANPDFFLSGWMPYWDTTRAEKVVDLYGQQLHEICVFGYQFREDGTVVPADPWVKRQVKHLKSLPSKATPPRILITVVNDLSDKMKDPDIVHRVLSNNVARKLHIRQLVAIAKEADGLEIDYEKVRESDRAAFTKFIQELSAELHANRLWLTVVVEPKTKPEGGIDWTAIGAAADEVKIMAYYYHYPGGDPGPTATVANLEAQVAYAITEVPKQKLSIALSLYGHSWPQGGTGSQVDPAQALDLARRFHAKVERDRDSQCQHFLYMDPKGFLRDVWMEDATSIRVKIEALARLGIPRVSLWHLGAAEKIFKE